MTTIIQDHVPAEEARLDLLGREQFVDRLLSITEALSANKKNACYAINGRWGTGKTYVLSMFEDRVKRIKISERDFGEKYLVFRYNCWEYDYYDEPLVAITAAMLDNIAKNPSILDQDIRSEVFDALKAAGNGLLKATAKIAETKTGIPLTQTVPFFQRIINSLTGQTRGEYDAYSSFNKYLKQLKDKIADLAVRQTILILVDELDRCLPEYTIKVLERLHHLFYGIDNVQVILCLDHTQLEHTVKQIYGQDTNVTEYLKKFIDFEIDLEIGTIDSDVFDERFCDYIKMFEGLAGDISAEDVNNFKTTILEGIDIRSRIGLVEKCNLIHGLVAKGEPKDFRYLCLELFLAVIYYNNIDLDKAVRAFRITKLFTTPNILKNNSDNTRVATEGLSLLSAQYGEQCYPDGSCQIMHKNSFSGGYDIETRSLLGILLYVYRGILGFKDAVYNSTPSQREDFKIVDDYSKKFWGFLNTIR